LNLCVGKIEPAGGNCRESERACVAHCAPQPYPGSATGIENADAVRAQRCSTSLPKRRSHAGGRCPGFSPTRGPRRIAGVEAKTFAKPTPDSLTSARRVVSLLPQDRPCRTPQ
jgi:hypothetical protein